MDSLATNKHTIFYSFHGSQVCTYMKAFNVKILWFTIFLHFILTYSNFFSAGYFHAFLDLFAQVMSWITIFLTKRTPFSLLKGLSFIGVSFILLGLNKITNLRQIVVFWLNGGKIFILFKFVQISVSAVIHLSHELKSDRCGDFIICIDRFCFAECLVCLMSCFH